MDVPPIEKIDWFKVHPALSATVHFGGDVYGRYDGATARKSDRTCTQFETRCNRNYMEPEAK